MHKQHEDQPSNELPNLSTWHRVPVGAVIPKGVPYAYTYEGGLRVELDGYSCDTYVSNNRYYTEHPITPPLPTEEGATILASGNDLPPHTLLTREGGRWLTCYGAEWTVKITSWCPVTLGLMVPMR